MIPVPIEQGLPLRRLACGRCGTAFECGRDGICWCMDEAYRMPVPLDTRQDCLCRACLRAAAMSGPSA